MIGEQFVPDVMKIANQRNVHADRIELVTNFWNRRRSLIAIDRDAHKFRSGLGERCDLRHSGFDIRGIGIGHALDDNWRAAADDDRSRARPDPHANAMTTQ